MSRGFGRGLPELCYGRLANTSDWPIVGSMLDQRLRRWPNIEPTMGECLMFVVRLEEQSIKCLPDACCRRCLSHVFPDPGKLARAVNDWLKSLINLSGWQSGGRGTELLAAHCLARTREFKPRFGGPITGLLFWEIPLVSPYLCSPMLM